MPGSTMRFPKMKLPSRPKRKFPRVLRAAPTPMLLLAASGVGYLRPPFAEASARTQEPTRISMKPIQMVDLVGQYEKIKPEVDAALLNVIKSAAFINGPEVKGFEQDLAAYLGAKH